MLKKKLEWPFAKVIFRSLEGGLVKLWAVDVQIWVTFRQLTENFEIKYIETGEPKKKAIHIKFSKCCKKGKVYWAF